MKSRKSDRISESEKIVQLQQNIIHYRAEIGTYENKITELATLLEKEKIRNHYLQEKLYAAEHNNIEVYQKQIHTLKEKLLSYEVALEEEKKRTALFQQKTVEDEIKKESVHRRISNNAELLSYFNYSIMLPEQEEEEEVLVFGDFVIKNIGTIPLNSIILCIKITPHQLSQLSAKIAISSNSSEALQLAARSVEEWVYVHENWKEKIKNHGEYWIKPIDKEALQPNDFRRFSSFEIRARRPETQNGIRIEGFAYCKEIPKGTNALNRVIINF